MRLNNLIDYADTLPGFDQIVGDLQHSTAVHLDGLYGTAIAFTLARLFKRLDRPMLLLTYSPDQAQRLWDDLTKFGIPEEQIATLPAMQSLYLQGDITDTRVIGERITALNLLASGSPCIIIAPIEAALQLTVPPEMLTQRNFNLEVDEEIDPFHIADQLVELGYTHASTVTRPGEFSRRGSILDLFSSIESAPARIEFFGDKIESIRIFDVATQRSIRRQAMIEVAPARELNMKQIDCSLTAMRDAYKKRHKELSAERGADAADRLSDRVEADIMQLQQCAYFDGMEQYLRYLLPDVNSAFSFMPANSLLVLDDPYRMKDHWDRLVGDLRSARERHWQRGECLDAEPGFMDWDYFVQQLEAHGLLMLSHMEKLPDQMPPAKLFHIHCAGTDIYRGRLHGMADEIAAWLANDCRVVLASDQAHRVREICAELNLPLLPASASMERAGLHVCEGGLRAGFKLDDIRLYLLTDAELFGSARPVQTRRRVAGGTAISSVHDLKVNDYVVHIHHGIGIYKGMLKRKVDGAERDYMLIVYLEGDRLYVPADQIDRLQRYQATDGNPPQISRIGGQDWQKTKRKVREQAREMAAELIRLYAARNAAQRLPFPPDAPWQEEMEDGFPYTETPSQLRAIQETKVDMEQGRPMDRLICGDVGFGKTEVAIRAAFKAVLAGKQVAVLCPTTVLAAQHHTTFTERLAAFPVKVDLLSRFRSRQQQLATVKELAEGNVDIVVGTHRLLSKDVQFQNLGLVIVDEEQRFGVAHKERLKQMKVSVDVLTLSATPIPRTLSMALSGLRDMSVIEDPPEGRMPVLTNVREYEDDLIRDAILREMERGGQIYFVHNRIESIYHVQQHLLKLVPDLRIEVGHGQMSEDDLEQVMVRFYHHEADLLLCTTIIENGLDVSNANTIIIDNADHMGLSQLYQLRGRVGRSSRQAYAYLLFRRHKALTEVAEHRLMAMREFSALGSGHRVAMRDMELRGAGNLLGAEQSGAMISVGFDLYCQLLQQAVQELQGNEPVDDLLPSVDLPVTAFIPDEYIPGEAERIFFYRRMSGVRSIADVESLQQELEDRFGDPPKPVWEALSVLRLRVRCQDVGISAIRCEGTTINIRFAGKVKLTPRAVQILTTAFKGYKFLPDGVSAPLRSSKVLIEVEEMVDVLEKALKMGSK